MTWTLNETLQRPSSKRAFVQNIRDTGSASWSWIRFDKMVGGSDQKDTLNAVPKFAHVKSAFAKRLDTASRIQLSLTFLIIVIVCNTVKLLTMLWVVFMERKDYIVTLGDGAASFLE